MAIHHGAVTAGRFGPVGAAPVVISRLVDAEIARKQLRQHSDLDIALIVSATVYDEVIQSRLHDLHPEAFSRTTVRAKGVTYAGYLCQHIGILRDRSSPGPQSGPVNGQLLVRADEQNVLNRYEPAPGHDEPEPPAGRNAAAATVF